MPSNIEVKARITDRDALIAAAKSVSGRPEKILHQTDTFFQVPNGRLKVRKLARDAGKLIYYERADQAGPKTSEYRLTPTSDPEGLRCTLARSLPMLGEVKKQRTVYFVGQTRIHIDRVDGLGDFVELEVMIQPNQTLEQGEEIALNLMAQLGITEADLIEVAYLDLLIQNGQAVPGT
jgi:predicted adenylyl cyclase CyaB